MGGGGGGGGGGVVAGMWGQLPSPKKIKFFLLSYIYIVFAPPKCKKKKENKRAK